jgi:acetyl esterase
MPLDPQVQQMLDAMSALGEEPLEALSVEAARERSAAMVDPSTFPPYAGRIEDRVLPGPGGELPVRIYTPAGAGPFPILMYFHGGGFVLGSLDNSETVCRVLSTQSGSIVISVDYRLAPEHKFPAAVEDCCAATCWAAAHAQEIGGDASRLAVSGDSAGGNLAAVVALRCRDEAGPALCGQLLIYPVTEHYSAGMESYASNADGYFLTKLAMQWFLDHYLNGPEDAAHPHLAPLRVTSLGGLPPAFVITAEYDPLRDEGDRYAKRLREAGVDTVHRPCEGMIHGFYGAIGLIDTADDVVAESSAWLKKVLSA